MRIKGAIFDMDGTLLDSMSIWNRIGEEYLRSLNVEPKENLNEIFKNMSLYQAACYYQQEYGITLTTDEIMDGVNQMIEHYYSHEVESKEGVMELLAAFRKKGVKMCVATATDRHLVEAALARNGIRSYFSEIFTCTQVGHGKDEPVIYETALEFLGTEKENTLVFEDALYAMETVVKAGFHGAAVYDVHEKEQAGLKALGDYYFEDFSQAEEVLG